MPRPYTPAIADVIFARISCGSTVQQALKGEGFPNLVEFYAWLRESDEFRAGYEIARECKADTLVEQSLEIADECAADTEEVQLARLRIDTRKWIAAKFVPKRYGERIDSSVDHTYYAAIPVPVAARNSDALDAARGPPERRH